MSIEALIAKVEAEHRLVRFLPERTRRPCRRRAFLSSQFSRELSNPNSAMALMRGSGYIQAQLTKWVLGDPIYKGFLNLDFSNVASFGLADPLLNG
jgi:hypothetical protein